jgi:hypothetical protein
MKEFIGIVTESLRDVHIATNKLIRENSTEVLEAELDPLITPYGIIITTMKFIIDDGEEFFNGTDN